MSRLKLWSNSESSSGRGSANSGRKDGSSSKMSCSGLRRISECRAQGTRMVFAHLALPASGSSAVFFTVRSITRKVLCAFSASERTYPHCCKYTRDTPYLHASAVCHPEQVWRRDVQQIALQTQSHGRHRIDNGLACFGYINFENLLAVDALQAGIRTKCCHKPYGRHAVFARREHYKSQFCWLELKSRIRAYLRDCRTYC